MLLLRVKTMPTTDRADSTHSPHSTAARKPRRMLFARAHTALLASVLCVMSAAVAEAGMQQSSPQNQPLTSLQKAKQFPFQQEPAYQCLKTKDIRGFEIVSNTIIRFEMADNSTSLMLVSPTCPQLKFHDYFSYIPVDGALCAGRDSLTARSGETCAVTSIDHNPILPALEKAEVAAGEDDVIITGVRTERSNTTDDDAEDTAPSTRALKPLPSSTPR